MGQHWTSHAVANGVNAWDRGLEMLVYIDTPGLILADAYLF
jgi:hypothetical protein